MLENNKESLKRRAEIVAKTDGLLKPNESNSIYREFPRMDGTMARARAKWQEQQRKSCDNSPQENTNQEGARGALVLNSCLIRSINKVTSLAEKLNQRASKAHSKGSKTTVSFKSTNAKPELLLDLEAMKKQEEIDEQLAVKKRQAEIQKKQQMNMRIFSEKLEIAKLKGEKARAKRISEKKTELARAESSRASTNFWSVTTVHIQSVQFKNVPS